MAQMKMLRQVMSPADIYTHADTICDMLRDHYGSYDADSLDEVMVEETFGQRLAAKGYDLLPEGAEPDDRPMAPPPPSRRELPRAEISQVPVRRPALNGGGVPLRRREPGDSEGQLPLRRDGEGSGVPMRRSPQVADSELPMRRNLPAGESDRGGPMRRRPLDGDMSSPMRRRPATGEGDNVSLPRRRPMQTGEVGPMRSRPEGSAPAERPPLQRQDLPVRDMRTAPETQAASETVAARIEQPVPAQAAPPVTMGERVNEAPEPIQQAPTAAIEATAQSPAIEVAAPAEAKPAPKPRARRTTRAKIASSESGEPQSEG